MPKRILIIDAHPDPAPERLGRALVAAYLAGAEAGGHEVRVLVLASLDFPWLRTSDDFQRGRPPAAIAAAQRDIEWAGHLVIVYPLWLGSMPALAKAFFEQCLRPGFAFDPARGRGLPRQRLKGRSARVVVTMGMPALFYRWFYRAHSLKSFERNMLHFCGIRPVRATVIGSIESSAGRTHALAALRALGGKGA